MPKAKKDLLFVCYSHTDGSYKTRLDKFLRGGGLPENLDIFSDANIESGEEWQTKIMEALRKATAALVLVSQDFMISPFIQQVEMRDLLLAQARRGLRLFLVPVRATYYDGTYLQRFQWARAPNKPLSLLREEEQETAMVEVCQLISRELAKPVDTPTIEHTIECLKSIPRLDLPEIYELQRFVGEGDYAQCFLATDRLLDRPVIIKVLREELSRDSAAYDRYVRSVAKLHHRSILGVLFSQTNKLPHFIVTPSVPETLRDRMTLPDLARRPTFAQALQWIVQMADTLHFAHDRACVHGRLRPCEVRLDDNQPILTGFRTTDALAARPVTMSGEPISLDDFWYASPEMRRDGGTTAKSDQYLLGLIAYELIAGGRRVEFKTWDALSNPDVAAAIDRPQPLHEFVEPCNERVSDVIMKALRTDAGQRWENLNEFARSLEEAQSTQYCFEAAKASYRKCAQQPSFYQTVYDKLFADMPVAANMFKNVSLERQFDVLRDALWLLLKYPAARDADEPTILSRVARTHSQITAHEYDLFRDAILAAVAKHDAPSAVEHWRHAMEPGFEYLKHQLPKVEPARDGAAGRARTVTAATAR